MSSLQSAKAAVYAARSTAGGNGERSVCFPLVFSLLPCQHLRTLVAVCSAFVVCTARTKIVAHVKDPMCSFWKGPTAASDVPPPHTHTHSVSQGHTADFMDSPPTHTHARARTHIHTCTRTYTHTHMHTHAHTYACARKRISTFARARGRTHTHIHTRATLVRATQMVLLTGFTIRGGILLV